MGIIKGYSLIGGGIVESEVRQFVVTSFHALQDTNIVHSFIQIYLRPNCVMLGSIHKLHHTHLGNLRAIVGGPLDDYALFA